MTIVRVDEINEAVAVIFYATVGDLRLTAQALTSAIQVIFIDLASYYYYPL